MSYTIAKLKTDAENHLHGTTLNKVPGVDSMIAEAARNALNKVDFRETKRISQISNALYDQVYSYVLPTDLKGKKIVDIRPQANQETDDQFMQWYNGEFQQYKDNNTFAVQDNSGVKTLKISKELTAGTTLHTMDSISNNGTWAVSNNATTLAADSVYKLTGSNSLKFTITAGGTNGTLTNSTMTSVDLSALEDQGSAFLPVFLSSPTNVTGIKLTWGNDASNNWSRTITTSNDSTSLRTGWNVCRFDWDGATETGTPDSSDVDYVVIDIIYDGTAVTTVRVDNLVFRLPTIYDIEYYSKYLFQNTAGTWLEEVSDDSDIINLEAESRNILLYEFLILATQAIQGEEMLRDMEFFITRLDQEMETYLQDNKSETIKPNSTYYRTWYNRRR